MMKIIIGLYSILNYVKKIHSLFLKKFRQILYINCWILGKQNDWSGFLPTKTVNKFGGNKVIFTAR